MAAVIPLDDGNLAEQDLMLFDQIEFSLMLRLSGTGPRSRARLVAGLKKAGLLSSGNQFKGRLCVKDDIRLEGGVTVTAKSTLHVAELNDGLIITRASSLRANLQLVLRAKHGIPDSLVSLDGQRNFSKPMAECDDSDLELQFEAIGQCVDRLQRAVVGCLPGCVVEEEELQLRKAEVCHDAACPDAEVIARATCRVPVPGSRLGSYTDYRHTTEVGRSPTWHFMTRKRGPVRKGYAKLRTLLRTELSCPYRDAVVACVGYRSASTVDCHGAVELALEFYHAAGTLCCEALDHVRAVSTGARTISELLAQLDRLRAIAARERSSEGYTPSARAAADAHRMLNALLSDGIAGARGLRKGTKVRDELERLVAIGVLVRGATPGVYCLASDYGLALPGCQAECLRD